MTLPSLFAAQAARTPDAIAVVFEDRTLSYAALEAHANALAHHLRELGVAPETIVGLCVERSLNMLVGLLGILKAGGAYLPLDPEYPAAPDCRNEDGAGLGVACDRGRAGSRPHSAGACGRDRTMWSVDVAQRRSAG